MAKREVVVSGVWDGSSLEGGLSRASGQVDSFVKVLGGVGLLAGGAVVAGLGSAVSAAANFDSVLSGIAAVGGPAVAAQMDTISAKALQIGKDTAFSASEGASAIEELVKAGVSVDAVLGGAADATVALAAAGGVELPRAAEIMSAAMNGFGKSAAEMPHIADLFAGAANASAIDILQLGESMKYIAPVAKSFGQSIDDTTAAVAVLGNNAITGSMAGTSLRSMFLSLASPGKQALAVIQNLGVQAFDATGKMKPLPAVLDELKNATAGLNDQAKGAALETIFGKESLSSVLALMEAGSAGINKMKQDMAEMTAADVAAARLDNLKGSLQQFMGSLETVGIIIGMAFQPALKAATDTATAFLNRLIPVAEFLGKVLPAAIMGAQTGLDTINPGRLAMLGDEATVTKDKMGLVGYAMQGLSTAFQFAKQHAVAFGLALAPIAITIGVQLVSSLYRGVISVAAFAWTLYTQGIKSVWAFAMSITTTLVAAIMRMYTVFTTRGVMGVLRLAGTFLFNLLPAAVQTAAVMVGTVIKAALAMAVTFLTQTIPSVAATAIAFLTQIVPAAILTASTFLTTMIPAAISAAATFLTVTIPAAIATAVTFLTVTVPAAIMTAVTFLTTLIPAIIATATTFIVTLIPTLISVGVGFITMTITALTALAGLVMGAITAAIGIIVPLLPIIIVAGLIGAAIYLLYQNWSKIWAAIVKYTGMAGAKIGEILRSAVKWITDLIKRAGVYLYERFHGAFTAIIKIAKDWAGKIYKGVTSGISSLANKVMEILKWLGNKALDAFTGILDGILGLLKQIPGVTTIIGKIGDGVKAGRGFLKGLTDSFKMGGDDASKGFVDKLSDGLDAGLKGAGFEAGLDGVKGMLGLDALGLGGGGAGGAGGAGAAAKDATGVWSGIDGKGAWTIDPGTGAKVYEAGSVGALAQQNAASDKAASEAAKQAKAGRTARSNVASAAAAQLKGGEALDLAKALAGAVSESITAIQDLVGAAIPPATAYLPQLDKIKDFWLAIGATFKGVFSSATDDVGTGGALGKKDLEKLEVWATPFDSLLATLGKSFDVLDKFHTFKAPEDVAGPLAVVKDFLARVSVIGKETMALITTTEAETLEPLTKALGGVVDLVSKSLDVLAKPGKTAAMMAPAKAAIEDLLGWVAGVGGSFLRGPGYDLNKDRQRTFADLELISAVFDTISDVLGVVSSGVVFLTGSANKVRALEPAASKAISEAMMWVAGLAGGLLRGPVDPKTGKAAYDLTIDRARTAGDLITVRDVLATIGAGLDTVAKAVSFEAAARKVKMVTQSSKAAIEDAMGWVAKFSAGLLRGVAEDGKPYDLTIDRERVTKDLAVVRDILTTIGTGLDTMVKAAGLGLVAATRVTDDVLTIIEQNTQNVIRTIVGIKNAWTNADGELNPILSTIKAFADTVAGAFDLASKALMVGVDWAKASLATSDALSIAERNADAILITVVGLVALWSDADGVLFPVLAIVASFADSAKAALTLVTDALMIGVKWGDATLATYDAAEIARRNIDYLLSTIVEIVNLWTDADGVLFPVLAHISAFAASAADALGLVQAALMVGVEWGSATLATYDAAEIVKRNVDYLLITISEVAALWTDAKGALFPVLATISDFAGAAGAALELVRDALMVGVEWGKAALATADAMSIAERNTDYILLTVVGLVNLWSDAKGALFPVIALVKDFSAAAGSAIDLIVKALDLGELSKRAKPVNARAFDVVAENIKHAVRVLAQMLTDVGADVAKDASTMALAAAPVVELIGKALDAFDLERLMKSPFIDAKFRNSSVMRGAAQTRATYFAENVKKGIKLMFDTLRDAVMNIGNVAPEVATKVNAIVSAYTPLFDLFDKINGLTIDTGKLSALAAAIRTLMAPFLGAAGGAGAGGAGGGAFATAGAVGVNAWAQRGSVPPDPGLVANAIGVIVNAWAQRGSIPPDPSVVANAIGNVINAWAQRGSIPAPGTGDIYPRGMPDSEGGAFGGPSLFTGPATLTGPVTFQGTQTVNVYLDGEIVQRSQQTGKWNDQRRRSAAGAGAV